VRPAWQCYVAVPPAVVEFSAWLLLLAPNHCVALQCVTGVKSIRLASPKATAMGPPMSALGSKTGRASPARKIPLERSGTKLDKWPSVGSLDIPLAAAAPELSLPPSAASSSMGLGVCLGLHLALSLYLWVKVRSTPNK
jgi:hypothetical protein